MKAQDNNIYETLDTCLFCGSKKLAAILTTKDFLVGNPGDFSLCRCQKCGLVFQNPRVKESFIGDFYSDDLGYFTSNQDNAHDSKQVPKLRSVLVNHFGYSHLGKRSLGGWLKTSLWKNRTKIQLFPEWRRGGTLLEIGCAHGRHLQQLKALGWTVSGLEPNKGAADFAKNKRGLSVKTGRVSQAKYPKASFDVVIMSMVLEHLSEPFKMLDEITDWLKPGGQLLFSIPYFEGLEFSMFKEFAYGLHLPMHYSFPNKAVLNRYFAKKGYWKPKYFFQYVDRDLLASLAYKAEELDSRCLKVLHKAISCPPLRKGIIKPVIFLMSMIGKTSRVTVMVNKKG